MDKMLLRQAYRVLGELATEAARELNGINSGVIFCPDPRLYKDLAVVIERAAALQECVTTYLDTHCR